MKRVRSILLLASVLALLGSALALFWFLAGPRWTEERVEEVVITTLQSEAPASFLVTGTLQITTTIQSRNTRVFMPFFLNLNLGTTEVTVRAPGRVSYGFDVRAVTADQIRLDEDGVVEVELPDLRVFGVEPDLKAMEIQTDVGWARLHGRSGQEQERRALGLVGDALRSQAEEHLQESVQPRINAARAIEYALRPAFEAAGIEDPVFRFVLGPGLNLETGEPRTE